MRGAHPCSLASPGAGKKWKDTSRPGAATEVGAHLAATQPRWAATSTARPMSERTYRMRPTYDQDSHMRPAPHAEARSSRKSGSGGFTWISGMHRMREGILPILCIDVEFPGGTSFHARELLV